MKSKKKTTSRSSRVRLERDPVPWKFALTAVFFAALLGFGFFWAANLHFVSMNIGIDNNKMRGQIDDLRSQNRRLTLLRETALSPQEIREAASRIGLRSLTVSSLMPVGADPVFASAPAEKSVVEAEVVKTLLQSRTGSSPERNAGETTESAPQAKAPKVNKTVKAAPVRETPVVAEKPEDPKTATRSRIIDTVAKR